MKLLVSHLLSLFYIERGLTVFFNLPALMLSFAIMWNPSHLGFSCFMTNGWDVGKQAMS